MVDIDSEALAKGTRDVLAQAGEWDRSVGRTYGYAKAGAGLLGCVFMAALIWLFWTMLPGWWATVPIVIFSTLFLLCAFHGRAGLSKEYRASELAYDHVKSRLAPASRVLRLAGWLGLLKYVPVNRLTGKNGSASGDRPR